MDKAELLAELDTYFAVRAPDTLVGSLGSINIFQVRGAVTRTNNIAEEMNLLFYVYNEGEPEELAFYAGEVINRLWAKKVEDYITVTNDWSGRIFSTNKPRAICRVLESAAEGEKWVLITETAPDTYSKEDITGDIIIDM